MPENIVIAGRSDVGQLRRRNEDSFAVFPELGVAVVADGMGGHPGGDVASRIAAETAAGTLAEAVRGRSGTDDDFVDAFRRIMREAVLGAHAAIREEGRANPELDGMGTTLTAMVVDADRRWVVGHVGDSRAYRLRDGELHQLTRDDTWVQDQIDQGAMKPESARLSPYAHLLTQCVGLEDEPTPQLLDGHAVPGDVFLLCTDGLVGMLEDGRVAEILRKDGGDGPPHGPLDALVEAANEAGGHDNITATLVRVG